ncbi:predicted protein [Botrytis cinerea T4]|uniref:Uncharacterized protein n=1 Tax=Botryotinia fuckeliana (strain T4) TaxID=999810 RepID=G2YF33_BOTF4|nr:predicted protein [Botrytis cinerea T4]
MEFVGLPTERLPKDEISSVIGAHITFLDVYPVLKGTAI